MKKYWKGNSRNPSCFMKAFKIALNRSKSKCKIKEMIWLGKILIAWQKHVFEKVNVWVEMIHNKVLGHFLVERNLNRVSLKPLWNDLIPVVTTLHSNEEDAYISNDMFWYQMPDAALYASCS